MKTFAVRVMRALLPTITGGLLLVAPVGSWAQQILKYSYKGSGAVTKYTEQHTLDVGDVTGHQIRVVSLETKYANDAPEYDGVKVVESAAWLTSDYIGGSGRFTQYAVLQMANGDKILTRTEALTLTSISTDGRKSSFSTVTTLTGGTGKFATIRGTIRGSGSTDFKNPLTINPSEGEYWFAK